MFQPIRQGVTKFASYSKIAYVIIHVYWLDRVGWPHRWQKWKLNVKMRNKSPFSSKVIFPFSFLSVVFQQHDLHIEKQFVELHACVLRYLHTCEQTIRKSNKKYSEFTLHLGGGNLYPTLRMFYHRGSRQQFLFRTWNTLYVPRRGNVFTNTQSAIRTPRLSPFPFINFISL